MRSKNVVARAVERRRRPIPPPFTPQLIETVILQPLLSALPLEMNENHETTTLSEPLTRHVTDTFMYYDYDVPNSYFDHATPLARNVPLSDNTDHPAQDFQSWNLEGVQRDSDTTLPAARDVPSATYPLHLQSGNHYQHNMQPTFPDQPEATIIDVFMRGQTPTVLRDDGDHRDSPLTTSTKQHSGGFATQSLAEGLMVPEVSHGLSSHPFFQQAQYEMDHARAGPNYERLEALHEDRHDAMWGYDFLGNLVYLGEGTGIQEVQENDVEEENRIIPIAHLSDWGSSEVEIESDEDLHTLKSVDPTHVPPAPKPRIHNIFPSPRRSIEFIYPPTEPHTPNIIGNTSTPRRAFHHPRSMTSSSTSSLVGQFPTWEPDNIRESNLSNPQLAATVKPECPKPRPHVLNDTSNMQSTFNNTETHRQYCACCRLCGAAGTVPNFPTAHRLYSHHSGSSSFSSTEASKHVTSHTTPPAAPDASNNISPPSDIHHLNLIFDWINNTISSVDNMGHKFSKLRAPGILWTDDAELCQKILSSLEATKMALSRRFHLTEEQWKLRTPRWESQYTQRLNSLQRTLQKLCGMCTSICGRYRPLRQDQLDKLLIKLGAFEMKLQDLCSKFNSLFDRLKARHIHSLLCIAHMKALQLQELRKENDRENFKRLWSEGKEMRAHLRHQYIKYRTGKYPKAI